MDNSALYTVVTGATGFVGNAVIKRLRELGNVLVRASVRNTEALAGADMAGYETLQIFDISADTDWQPALHNAGVVIHAAARVHVMADEATDPLAEFRAVNVDGTLNLARQAAAAGVKRFIFISSIKVNGEGTTTIPYRHSDKPAPEDAYGQSKSEAETCLRALTAKTGMELVIIRPPLVYGPGVKANFAALMNLARKNLPLPLGAVRNKRSLVALDNLVDLIVTCIDHPKAASQTFLVSDGEDVSTTELLTLMTRAAGKTPHLLPVPMSWLQKGAGMLGKKAIADRLCGSLQLDITHTRETLNWAPPLTIKQGIEQCFK
jgi:nucleoside-diphosphate-sugar epimerase